MLYTLLQAYRRRTCISSKGRTFCQSASRLLGVDPSYMEKHLMDLAVDRKIIQKEERRSRFWYILPSIITWN